MLRRTEMIDSPSQKEAAAQMLCGSLQFEIPFNRQQLADYLNLDRSALSKELCKMRDEGLLEFEKNRFCLKEDLE